MGTEFYAHLTTSEAETDARLATSEVETDRLIKNLWVYFDTLSYAQKGKVSV
jgi:hypothetical protein